MRRVATIAGTLYISVLMFSALSRQRSASSRVQSTAHKASNTKFALPSSHNHESTHWEDESFELVKLFRDSLRALQPRAFRRTPGNKFRGILKPETISKELVTFPEDYLDKSIIPRLDRFVSIVDIGANAGQFAIPSAKQGHVVYSFEPNPETCQTLKQRVAKMKVTSKVRTKKLSTSAPTAGLKSSTCVFALNDTCSSFTFKTTGSCTLCSCR